jgi:excisionase family DNA binding protein
MKPLLNTKSVCQILGVSPAVLSRWVHSNKIPYVLLTSGKKKLVVRFREEELEAWLNRRSRGAVPKLRSNLSEVDKKIGKTAQHIETKDNVLV